MYWDRQAPYIGRWFTSLTPCWVHRLPSSLVDYQSNFEESYDDNVTWKTSQYEGKQKGCGEISTFLIGVPLCGDVLIFMCEIAEFLYFMLVTTRLWHNEGAFNICCFDLVQDLQKLLNIDISALFGDMGRKFMRASLKLRISNDIANLAFIRHIISYYSFHWTAAAYTQESMESLISLRDHLPKLKEIHKYFKENDISSLNKFVRKWSFRRLM